MMESRRSINTCFFLTAIFWAISVAAVFIIYFEIGIDKFSAYTDIENPIINLLEDHSTYLFGCTNQSTGDENKSFMKKTLLASNCQQPSNPCLITICNGNRICEEQRKENATCSQDSNCDPRFKCDLDMCSCVENPMLASCMVNSDCPTIENNNCENYTCVNQTCVLSTLPGIECANNQECGVDEFCGNNCSCVVLNITAAGFCTQDSECPSIFNNGCESYSCVNNTCVLSNIDGVECASSQDCLEGQYCVTGCLCISINSTTTGSCTQNSDCLIIDDNPCENYTCQLGVCTLDTLPGMECANGQDCVENEFCSVNCTCVSITQSTGECNVDSDCPTISNNPCANYTCQIGTCVLNTTDGNQCSTSQQCGTNEICNSTCSCVGPYAEDSSVQEINMTFTAGSNDIVSLVKFSKSDSAIVFRFPQISGSNSATGPITVASGQIPSGFEPNFRGNYGEYLIRSESSSTVNFAYARVQEDGSMTFFADINGNGFATFSFNIFQGTFSWINTS